ncbi:MAG TPA: DinB family protein [Acidobacteriaceae bacterium]|jgi:uncharacterized damage-inducible protein DinB|nr:DinB family protein [Acidobacteriaceae bacterium]
MVGASFPDLFRHQAWADSALLATVHAHPQSLADDTVLKALRHILRVQRVFLARFHGGSGDEVRELPPEFGTMVALWRTTHQEQIAFVEGLAEADFARTFPMPALAIHPTFAEGLTQVILHSQNHRGQCLTRLRENGAAPPRLDYILWIKDRPAPSYPEIG